MAERAERAPERISTGKAASNLICRGGTWYARAEIRGRDVRRSLHTKSLQEARRRLQMVFAEMTSAPIDPTANRKLLIAAIKTQHGGKAARGQFVYFAQRKSGGPIKIGRSKTPEKRIRDLQKAGRLDLLLIGYLKATAEVERILHQRFEADRLVGEWFDSTPRLRRFIAALLAHA